MESARPQDVKASEQKIKEMININGETREEE